MDLHKGLGKGLMSEEDFGYEKSKVSNLDINASISSISDFNMDNYSQKEILEKTGSFERFYYGGKYSIQIKNKKVYLSLKNDEVSSMHDFDLEIGVTDIRKNIVFKLSDDPSKMQEENVELSCSGLTPKTKSSSPSMMLHQTASVSLIRVIEDDCIFEDKGEYTPDIRVFKYDSSYNIELTSNIKLKEVDFIKRNISNYIIINKYLILNPNSEFMRTFYTMSIRNDKKDVNFLYNLAKKHCDHSKLKMSYSEDLLEFFIKREDKRKRSLEEHRLIAENMFLKVLNEKIYEDRKLLDSKGIDRVFKLFCKHYEDSFTDGKFDRMSESQHFILPKNVDYKSIKKRENPYKKKIINQFGIFKLHDNKSDGIRIEEKKLFEVLDHDIRVTVGTFKSTLDYSKNKIDSTLKSSPMIMEMINKYGMDVTYQKLVRERISNHTNLKLDEDGKLKFKPKNYETSTGLEACDSMPSNRISFSNSFYLDEGTLDPNHLMIIEKFNVPELMVNIISQSRDYQELLFRRRIVIAIENLRKPGYKFRVNHHFDDRVHAEVMIKGLVFKADSGVCYVSYFFEDKLYRTDKWRLPDIESYSVAPDRLISCIIGSWNKLKNILKCKRMLTFYGRIIAENSWAEGAFFKAYRYLSSNLCMSSPLLEDSMIKLISVTTKPVLSKLSTFLIYSYFKQNDDFKYGKTPIFQLEFDNIGFECFLISLTPVNQYGIERHLNNSLEDLIKEIELYNNSGSIELIRSFENILEQDNLDKSYYDYILKIVNLSKETSGRFTWTPLSNLLLSKELDSIKFSPYSIQDNIVPISDLMTLKASHNTLEPKCGTAFETINDLSEFLGTKSISIMNMLIMNKKGIIDLGMRIFSKSDDYTNREISILNNMYRIIQFCSESFFKKFNSNSKNITTNSKTKHKDIYEEMEELIKCDERYIMTIDHSKWGPNNNTINFALNSCLLLNKTTEAYMSIASLLVMEFKCFEIPPWCTQFFNKVDSSYGVFGLIGRSHMGLGICQNSSSTYGSLMLSYFNNLFNDKIYKPYKKKLINTDISITYSHFSESDDAKSVFGVYSNSVVINLKEKIGEKLANIQKEHELKECKNVLNLYKNWTLKLNTFLNILGTLTSSYKNLFSETMGEYNSIYTSTDSIGSLDLKFLYSLIIPMTTGNCILDYRSVLNSYTEALNSGCSVSNSKLISYINMNKFCNQWKINLLEVGLPSDITLSYSLPNITSLSDHSFFKFETKNHLKFNNRENMNLMYSTLKDSLQSTMQNIKVEQILKSRAKAEYRSLLTFGDAKEDSFSTSSNYFKHLGGTGETCELFVKNQNINNNHVLLCVNNEHESSTIYELITKQTKPNHFQRMKFKKNTMEDISLFELLSGSYEPVEKLNSKSKDYEVLLHLMRDYRKGNVEIPDEFHNLGLLERMVFFDEILNENKGKDSSCNSYFYSRDLVSHEYPQLILINPIHYYDKENIIRIKCSLDKIDQNLMYRTTVNSEIYNLTLQDNNFLKTEISMGQVEFRSINIVELKINKPSIEEIISYIDERIIIENEDYLIKSGDECYLNMKIDKDLNFVNVQSNDLSYLFEEVPEDELANFLNNEEINFSMDDIEMNIINDFEFENAFSDDFISIRVNSLFKVYSENYMKRSLILNYYLNKLVEIGALSEYTASGYLINDFKITGPIYTVDKDLSRKINNVVSSLDNSFLKLLDTNRKDWLDLALCSISNINHSIAIRDYYKLFLISDSSLFFSNKPFGDIVNHDKFKNNILSKLDKYNYTNEI